MNIALQRNKVLWVEFFSLAKPRVVLLHLLTAAAAMFLAARGAPEISRVTFTLLGGALLAGSSNVFNNFLDRDIDALMTRTERRPLPAGRLGPAQALVFGVALGCAGTYILGRFVGWLPAALALGAWFYYVIVYTLLLKRHTSWSAIPGSGAGAFPPLIGWAAVTGRIEAAPFLLFAIVVLWSPPHSWSLALSRQSDFQSAGLAVLPSRKAALWILIFALLTVSASLVAVPLMGMGKLYLGLAISADLAFVVLSVQLLISENGILARKLFLFSLVYLAAIFGGMIADRIVF
jgi:heme o synthase